jgi:hypothetical protein
MPSVMSEPSKKLRSFQIKLDLTILNDRGLHCSTVYCRCFDLNGTNSLKEEDDLVEVGDIHVHELCGQPSELS